MGKGMIHLYCGDGKGKTTAAMGLALRAAGCGMQVVIVQFLKDGSSHELRQLQLLPNITVLAEKSCGVFSWQMTPGQRQEVARLQSQILQKALSLPCDLLVLDEVCAACELNLVDTPAVQELVEHKPEQLELVLTGRNPPEFLVRQADYITEMVNKKHPFDQGVPAREGIEF
ncbi:MAG: cob(I)yrinic acid a,c-diamide adenosyltransferase [Angelakisella sp.]